MNTTPNDAVASPCQACFFSGDRQALAEKVERDGSHLGALRRLGRRVICSKVSNNDYDVGRRASLGRLLLELQRKAQGDHETYFKWKLKRKK